jgi:hypothetical protein
MSDIYLYSEPGGRKRKVGKAKKKPRVREKEELNRLRKRGEDRKEFYTKRA